MQFKTLDDLLQHTCDRLAFLDGYKRTPAQSLLEAMYKSVQQDFTQNVELLLLTSDYKIEKKQLKYMLRKTKSLRKNTWKLSFIELVEDYKKNNFDMYDFNYDNLNNKIKEYKLFDKKGNPVCLRRKPKHNRKEKIFGFFRRKAKPRTPVKVVSREQETDKNE